MNSIVELLNPILWGAAAIAAAFALFAGAERNRESRLTAAALYALCAAGLLAAVAVASLLPPGALAVRPDGTTDDPRALSALALGAAALAGLAPALRALRLPPMGVLATLLPGLALAGLVTAVSYFIGLRAPLALATLVLGATVLGGGLSVFARVRWNGLGALALQLGAIGLLLVAGSLSSNGARASLLQLGEGAAVDTLGQHVSLGAVEAPNDSLRRIEFVLASGKGTSRVWTELRGRANTEMRATIGGGLFDGPLVVPMGLQETNPQAHGVVWMAKGDTVRSATSTVLFAGFRIVPGDTVKMFADLDVTTDGATERVSPGMYAMKQATTPFPARSAALGPVALGKIDADNGRVAVMLPAPAEGAGRVQRTAIFDLHLRPVLPLAWVGAGLAVLFFLLGLAAPERETHRG